MWERALQKPPKEQVPKRPLEQISQVDEPQRDASLESAYKTVRHPRGPHINFLGLNSQVKGQRRVDIHTLFLSFFCMDKREH